MRDAFNPRLSQFGILILLAILLSIVILFSVKRGASPDFEIITENVSGTSKPMYSSSFVCHECKAESVHSASITRTNTGLIVSWFGGSREGARDVQIFTSTKLSTDSGDWSAENAVLSSDESARELSRYIKKLGNPVLGRGADGRIWLFYVTVSAGGWSGSSISYQVSGDDGRTWSRSRRLVTSPFFNVSTLVRGSPVFHVDGSLSLPVYHELLGKFSELLHVSPEGKVLHKRRINFGRRAFQPAMTVLSKKEAVMIMRYKGGAPRRIMISHTDDAGQSWSVPAATSLPNPDAGISVATGPESSLLVVYNDSEQHRGNLALAISRDQGASWKKLHYFERENRSGQTDEFSYPAIIRQGNRYHLVYTWKRKGIRYVTFNQAWIRKLELGR